MTSSAPLSVTLLGTGGPIPDPHRAGPATLVSSETDHFLVDAGRGVLMRLAAAGIGVGQLKAVLLTHLHSDHITDLNDVITSRWVTTFEPTPLTIYGPVGTNEVVGHILASLKHDISYRIAHHEDLSYQPPVEVIELGEAPGAERSEEGTRLDGAHAALDISSDIAISWAPTDHRPVDPTVGYRFDLGGAAVVVAGDTIPCVGLDGLCKGANALVHTVLRKDVISQIPIPRLQDTLDYHSSPGEAAASAERAGLNTLILTHYVPAFPPGSGTAEEWRSLAATEFSGTIEVGDDLHRVEIHPS